MGHGWNSEGNECTMCVIVNEEGLLQFASFD